MIKISHIKKCFCKKEIIHDLSLDLPDKGLMALIGPSGCGKTTLLNILSGLIPCDEGEIDIDGFDLLKAKEQEKLNYRLHDLGYVFQNFCLIPLETGERNVSLVLDSSTNISRKFRRHKIKRLFSLFNINYLRKQKVNLMSGGEKQRIAILRAVVNNPKIILCDEPTGALDEKNSYEIMEILRQISVNSLVLVVSHDKELMEKFADEIIQMKDGKIVKRTKNKSSKKNHPAIENSGKKVKRAHIPNEYKLRYSLDKIKSKKVRTVISNLMLSLSLTGIGVSFLLSNIVTNRINDAFSSLTNGQQIMMRMKNQPLNAYGDIFSAPEKEVINIKEKYNEDIKGVGVNYLANFEDFFKDRNEVSFVADGKSYLLSGYSARNFNEYKWYEKSIVTYPFSTEIGLDDVVLGISYEDMSNLCYEFKIQRNYTSLGRFVIESNSQLVLRLENGDWEYDDEQVFNIVGVVQSNHPMLYHSDHLWNQYVFEEHMRFPTIEGGEQYAVWEMHKNYFVEAKSDLETLQNKLLFDPDYHNFIFKKADHDFNSVLCKTTENCQENRLYVYYSDVNGIFTNDIDYISDFYHELSSYYFTSEFGYSSYASNLLNGFSKNLFVSLDIEKINDAIDADTSLGNSEEVSINLPDGICGGSYLQSLDGSIKFSTKYKTMIEGREPKNLSEIVISYGLAKKLTSKNVLGKRLQIAAVKSESINAQRQLEKNYSVSSAVIVGITSEEKDYLYHSNLWTISFFRDKLNLNTFNLIPTGVVFELDDNQNTQSYVENISRLFPRYDVTSPQSEIIKSTGNVLDYAKTILLAFSLISLAISLLFLGTMVILQINESKDEIKLFNYLGIGPGQVRSLFRFQTLIRSLIAFLISTLELILIENIVTFVLNNSLHINKFSFQISLFPIVIVLICSLIVPIIITQLILVIVSKRKKVE